MEKTDNGQTCRRRSQVEEEGKEKKQHLHRPCLSLASFTRYKICCAVVVGSERWICAKRGNMSYLIHHVAKSKHFPLCFFSIYMLHMLDCTQLFLSSVLSSSRRHFFILSLSLSQSSPARRETVRSVHSRRAPTGRSIPSLSISRFCQADLELLQYFGSVWLLHMLRRSGVATKKTRATAHSNSNSETAHGGICVGRRASSDPVCSVWILFG